MRKLLLPILFILIAIVSFFWYTQPAYNDTSSIQAEIEEYDTAIEQVAEIQQIRDSLLSRYNQLPQSTLYVIDRVLPQELDTVRFLIELQQVALRSDLQINDISYGGGGGDDEGGVGSVGDSSVVPNKPYQSAAVSFSTSGSYAEVLEFIRAIEQSARIIDIVEVSISAGSEEGIGIGEETEENALPSGENNAYQITAYTYWLNDQDSQ